MEIHLDTVARIQLDTLNKWFNLVWQSFTEACNFRKSCKPYYKLLLPIDYYDTVGYGLRSETISISTNFLQHNRVPLSIAIFSQLMVLPQKRHLAVGKKTGRTICIERFNCTLRQRVSRLVRKTLSFSKKLDNHIAAIWNFIHHYNAVLPLWLSFPL